MKYCSKCGKEVFDEAVICPSCGCSVATESNGGRGLTTVAFVLMTIETLFMGIYVLIFFIVFGIGGVLAVGEVFGIGGALAKLVILKLVIFGVLMLLFAYMIFMTAKVASARKHNKSLSIGFKICVLLFMNFLAGIFLLCDKDI